MDDSTNPIHVIERIQQAVNEHDLDALALCFQVDYRSEQPIHPDRAFRGRDQMRKNWSQIFGGVPDIRADILRSALDGDTVWTEWHLHGTRRDGVPHQTAMITIAGVQENEIAWMRLYLETVSEGQGIDAAVRRDLAAGGTGR